MPGLRFVDIQTRPLEVLDLTSLTVEEFQTLIPLFEASFQTKMSTCCLDGIPRTGRAYTTYSNSPLPTPEDRLLFVLFFLKTNPLQVVLGRMFGMPQSKANIWLHLLLAVLRTTLTRTGDTPCRSIADLSKRLGITIQETVISLEDLNEQTPPEEAPTVDLPVENSGPDGALFCHDGTERRIQRPKDKEEQKLFYSGKKKCHTLKNLLLVNEELNIVYLSDTCEGKMHDKKMADATPYVLPQGSRLLQDLGFQGFNINGVETIMPIKKPRGLELTPDQKEVNRQISRRRVRIEHVNSSVKRCRVLKDTIRLIKKGVRDFVMEVCCALHNFRVRLTPWQAMV